MPVKMCSLSLDLILAKKVFKVMSDLHSLCPSDFIENCNTTTTTTSFRKLWAALACRSFITLWNWELLQVLLGRNVVIICCKVKRWGRGSASVHPRPLTPTLPPCWILNPLLCSAASLHLQRQHPGGRVLHADSLERAAHLLLRQHGSRQVQLT